MSVNLKGKIYRNQNEQIVENANDITKLEKRMTDLEESVEDSIEEINGDIEEINGNFSNYVSKGNLTDHSINEINAGASEIDSDNVDLNALYSQDVKSQLSLEPNSAIMRTMSGEDVSTIGVSATEVNVTTDTFKYNGNEVATVDDLPVTEKKTLVWTNPNPTSGFGPDNIPLDLTNVTNPKYLEIEWIDSSSTDGIRVDKFGWIDTGAYNYISQINMNSTGTYIMGRRFQISKIGNTTYAIFDDAYRSANFNTAAANNSNVIPYKIYAIE